MSATCLATGPGRVTWHCKARQGLGGFRRPRSRLGSVNMFELAMMASARHNGWSYLPYFPPSATPNHRSGGATDPGMGEFMHRTGRTAIARGPYPSATKDRDRNWQVLVGTDRPARRHSTAYSCLCMQKSASCIPAMAACVIDRGVECRSPAAAHCGKGKAFLCATWRATPMLDALGRRKRCGRGPAWPHRWRASGGRWGRRGLRPHPSLLPRRDGVACARVLCLSLLHDVAHDGVRLAMWQDHGGPPNFPKDQLEACEGGHCLHNRTGKRPATTPVGYQPHYHGLKPPPKPGTLSDTNPASAIHNCSIGHPNTDKCHR